VREKAGKDTTCTAGIIDCQSVKVLSNSWRWGYDTG